MSLTQDATWRRNLQPGTSANARGTNEVPIDILEENFVYDPATGDLRWRVTQPNGRQAGTPALTGYINKGHRQGSLGRVRLLRHRVCFALHHKRWPDGLVDHKNGVPSDDRAHNLREATSVQNHANTTKSWGASGRRGVRIRAGGRYQAQITIGGRRVALGTYGDLEEAARAYQRAVEAAYGEFAPKATAGQPRGFRDHHAFETTSLGGAV